MKPKRWTWWDKLKGRHTGLPQRIRPAGSAPTGTGFRAMELVEIELRPNDPVIWYRIWPGRLYPAMAAEVQRVLEAGEAGRPTGALVTLWEAARSLPREAWGLALNEKRFCAVPEVALRAQALELLRLWFTEMLQREHAGIPHPAEGEAMAPLGLHILRDEAWRL